jgi:hypothetical protein
MLVKFIQFQTSESNNLFCLGYNCINWTYCPYNWTDLFHLSLLHLFCCFYNFLFSRVMTAHLLCAVSGENQYGLWNEKNTDTK